MISLASPVRTPFHAIPAGPKLGLLCAFTIVVFSVDGAALGAGLALLVLALYAAGGVGFIRVGLRRLLVLWPFIAVIAVWHAATGELPRGLALCAKLAAAVGLANLVTMTTRLDDMVSVFCRLARPLRRLGLDDRSLGLAIALVIRFVPVLVAKGFEIAEAWRSRSTRRPGWRIVAPLAVAAVDDAEHVAEAIRARGGVEGRRGSR